MDEHDKILTGLRRQRDWHAAQGDHAEALTLNDRIKDFKEGRTSLDEPSETVKRVMKRFDSALARRRDYGPSTKQ